MPTPRIPWQHAHRHVAPAWSDTHTHFGCTAETNAYELGYQQTTTWGSAQVTPFYRRTPGAVRYVRAVGADESLERRSLT
jgi:hypothetical protein